MIFNATYLDMKGTIPTGMKATYFLHDIYGCSTFRTKYIGWCCNSIARHFPQKNICRITWNT